MFGREMRINLKGFLLWTLALALVFGGIVLAYPYMIGEGLAESLDAMMAAFPQEILRAFNMDVASISVASGWIKSEGMTLYVLAAALYAASLGANILLKERSERTLEAIWALPVSRAGIVLAHFVPGLIYIVLQHGIVMAAVAGSLALQNDFAAQEMLPVLASPLIATVSVYALCFALSTLFSRTGPMQAIGFAGVLLSYLLQIVSRMGEKMELLGRVSIFALCDVRAILERGAISVQEIGAGVLITLVSLAFALFVFDRRQLV